MKRVCNPLDILSVIISKTPKEQSVYKMSLQLLFDAAAEMDDREYEIGTIIDEKWDGEAYLSLKCGDRSISVKNKQYLVTWVGYDLRESSWIYRSNMNKALSVLLNWQYTHYITIKEKKCKLKKSDLIQCDNACCSGKCWDKECFISIVRPDRVGEYYHINAAKLL